MDGFFRNKRLFFSVADFIAWASLATGAFDFIFYSKQIGFTNTEIGTLYAVLGLVGIVIQPLWGMISDYIRSIRKVLLLCLACGALLNLLLPTSSSKAAVVFIAIANTLFITAFMPLLDNWIVRECAGKQEYHYGMVRIWGSIGFAVVVLFYGKLTQIVPVGTIYYGKALLFTVTMFLLYFYKYEDIGGINLRGRASEPGCMPAEPKKKDKPDIKGLLSNRAYLLFMIFTLIIHIPLTGANTFYPSLLLSVGGTNGTVGLVSALNAFIEIPFFLSGKKLTDKMGPRGLILLATIFLVIRMLGFFLAGNIWQVMGAFWLMAPFYSLYYSGTVYYVNSLSPHNTKAFALTFIQSFSIGIAGMLGNYSGGLLIDSFGLKSMYGYGVLIVFLAMVFYCLPQILSILKKRKGRLENGL